MKTGIELIAHERQEQIDKHGFDIKHDLVVNSNEQLQKAAMYLISYSPSDYPGDWLTKWRDNFDKKTHKERLIIAGAFIAAELDRIQNFEP